MFHKTKSILFRRWSAQFFFLSQPRDPARGTTARVRYFTESGTLMNVMVSSYKSPACRKMDHGLAGLLLSLKLRAFLKSYIEEILSVCIN